MDGNSIAEVKGHLREIEIYLRGTAEWWFIPVETDECNDLRDTLASHAESGMGGKIVIK